MLFVYLGLDKINQLAYYPQFRILYVLHLKLNIILVFDGRDKLNESHRVNIACLNLVESHNIDVFRYGVFALNIFCHEFFNICHSRNFFLFVYSYISYMV